MAPILPGWASWLSRLEGLRSVTLLLSVESATLGPSRDEFMEGLSLYYMHGWEGYACTNVCVMRQLDRGISSLSSRLDLWRGEGIMILACVVFAPPVMIGVRGREKGVGGDGSWESGSGLLQIISNSTPRWKQPRFEWFKPAHATRLKKASERATHRVQPLLVIIDGNHGGTNKRTLIQPPGPPFHPWGGDTHSHPTTNNKPALKWPLQAQVAAMLTMHINPQRGRAGLPPVRDAHPCCHAIRSTAGVTTKTRRRCRVSPYSTTVYSIL